jgi:Xaa-Pro aminopeptidase
MFDKRVEKVRNYFLQSNIDALLVSNFYNILYLTGFKTLTKDEREAFVLVTKNNTYLFTDERYVGFNSEFRIQNLELKLLTPEKGLIIHLKEIIEEEKIMSLGIESDDLRTHEYLKLQTFFPSIKITPIERLIIRQRVVKDEDEIEKIKKACEIADKCLENVLRLIKVRMTEKEIAFKLEYWLKENGADIAFDPIVAINKNSSIPHYNTKDGEGCVTDSSIILIDYGAKYQDYLSDITRMVFINPDSEMKNVYEKLLKAQQSTIDYLSNIKQLTEPDRYCQSQITNNKLPNYSHSTGHGVGLEIHEYPKVSQTSIDSIQDNQVFTIEPGVYFENKWGMRIEDTVVVKNGVAIPLTKFSKQLMVL